MVFFFLFHGLITSQENYSHNLHLHLLIMYNIQMLELTVHAIDSKIASGKYD